MSLAGPVTSRRRHRLRHYRRRHRRRRRRRHRRRTSPAQLAQPCLLQTHECGADCEDLAAATISRPLAGGSAILVDDHPAYHPEMMLLVCV